MYYKNRVYINAYVISVCYKLLNKLFIHSMPVRVVLRFNTVIFSFWGFRFGFLIFVFVEMSFLGCRVVHFHEP